MKKFLLIFGLALGMNTQADVAMKADLELINYTYDWLKIFVEDDLVGTLKEIQGGKYNAENVSVICFEGGDASNQLQNLEYFLNYLDEDEIMLYNFPRKDEYFQFRTMLNRWDEAIPMSNCEKLIAAGSATAAKPLVDEMLSLLSTTVPFDGLQLIEELYKFKEAWVPTKK